MSHSAEISRANPTCFLFLLDQSRSMAQPLGGGRGKTKAEAVAESINRLLYTLVLRCVSGPAVLDRFHVGVIGYGDQAAPALGGALAGRQLVPVSEVAKNPLRVETRTEQVEGDGGRVERTVRAPVWFEPRAAGKTAMCAALTLAWNLLADFLVDHAACYPPLVINVTDGTATDGDPEAHAACLRDLASGDGQVLLFNAHLSSRAERPIEFPDHESTLPDEPARRLFRMSSVLPDGLRQAAGQAGLSVGAYTRGFVFNADLVSVVRFLDVGTWVNPRNLR
jgi:hypothetical protein